MAPADNESDDRPTDPLAGSVDAYTLDHAVWHSLTGPHSHFAETRGDAARYPRDVSPFVAISPEPGSQVWDDLSELLGPGQPVGLAGDAVTPPDDWEIVGEGKGVQMIDTSLQAATDPVAVALSPVDVPEMLDLVARTKPGPFLPRTIELGNYVGIRDDGGMLIAMAGERIHPEGWTEISAVCTDSAHRGQGLATRLVATVAAGIRKRGETPFLHAAGTNVNAIRLYESIGFTVRRLTTFQFLRSPGDPEGTGST